MSKLIGGLKHRYPQEFLDQLAKDLGFEWTRVNFGTIGKDDCPIHPIPPPSGLLFYVDYKLNKDG